MSCVAAHKLYIIWLDLACCCWPKFSLVRSRTFWPYKQLLIAIVIVDVETNATLMNSLWSALADREIYSYSYIYDRQTAVFTSQLVSGFYDAYVASLKSHRWYRIVSIEYCEFLVEFPCHVSVAVLASFRFRQAPTIQRLIANFLICGFVATSLSISRIHKSLPKAEWEEEGGEIEKKTETFAISYQARIITSSLPR